MCDNFSCGYHRLHREVWKGAPVGTVDALCIQCKRPIRWDGGVRKCTACMITHVTPQVEAVEEAQRILKEAQRGNK